MAHIYGKSGELQQLCTRLFVEQDPEGAKGQSAMIG